MTEDVSRRGPAAGRHGAGLRERLAIARELLARTLADLRGGTLPVPTGDANVLDRDEALACAAKADGIAHYLRHPPRPAAGLEARDREQGEEP
jgi:hypothetical protein